MKPNSLSVTVWCPCYENQDGGIQQFSRLMVQGLESSPLVRNCQVVPLGKSFFAKIHFILQTHLGIIFQKPDLAIITHLHLARLSFVLRFLKIPYWICTHGIECWVPADQRYDKCLRNASQILCVSRYTQNRLQEIYSHLTLKTVVFPNHVLLPEPTIMTKEQARTALQLSPSGFLFLTVSRLASAEQYKGHRAMLKALHALKEQGVSANYLIAGDGDDRPALEQLSKSLGLEKHVTFLGRVKNSTLELAYTACDAFAMPSTGEGFGIVYLEALARGRPVLAGNRDGSVDPLMDGALGVLVDPLDQASLIQGLQKLQIEAQNSDLEVLKKAVLVEFGFAKLKQRLNFLLGSYFVVPMGEGPGGTPNPAGKMPALLKTKKSLCVE
jgi:glycosyltransferase involved in cell wall biosynthesis